MLTADLKPSYIRPLGDDRYATSASGTPLRRCIWSPGNPGKHTSTVILGKNITWNGQPSNAVETRVIAVDHQGRYYIVKTADEVEGPYELDQLAAIAMLEGFLEAY